MQTFGTVVDGVRYRERLAAYAVIPGNGATVAAVWWQGYYFLPGGGILVGEAAQQAVEREVHEELARDSYCGYPGSALQYFQAADGVAYRMHATFFLASFVGEPSGMGEHEVEWLDVQALEGRLFHASHLWAVRKAFSLPR